MKTVVLVLTAFVILALSLLAQTNAPPVTGLPVTHADYTMLFIAILTPFVVGLADRLVPCLPRWTLPVSTPFIGILMGLGINFMGSQHLSWFDMAQAGTMAVFLREVFNQAVTKQIVKQRLAEEEAKAKAKQAAIPEAPKNEEPEI